MVSRYGRHGLVHAVTRRIHLTVTIWRKRKPIGKSQIVLMEVAVIHLKAVFQQL